jgi:hypothetical protein
MVDAAARRLSAPKPLGVPHLLFVHHVLESSFRNEPFRDHDIWARSRTVEAREGNVEASGAIAVTSARPKDGLDNPPCPKLLLRLFGVSGTLKRSTKAYFSSC